MKKLLCLFLSAALTMLCCSVSLAAAAEEPPPVVVIRGMSFNGLTVDAGTENERNCVKGFDVGGLVKAILKGILRCLTRFSLDEFCVPVIAYVNDIMGELACDSDGNSVYNVSARTYPLAVSNYPELTDGSDTTNERGIVMTCADTYGADRTYYFNYDWRLEPAENAALVNEMVTRAKTEHRCEKVHLVCASMGGAVTVAYLSLYGYESVEKCVFLSSTFQGAYVVSDLLNGRVHTDPDALYAFVSNLVGADTSTGKFITVLQKIGFIRVLTAIANRFYEKEVAFVHEHFLRDCFATMPALWAIVLPEEFDGAMEYVFPTEELQTKYAGLIEKATRANAYMANAADLLREADAYMDIVVMATYGTPLIPIYERAAAQGDGTLETALMAGGATVADFGETLPDSYVPGDARYLSPDRVVDVSTALFPEYTWIFKNAPHVSCSYGTDIADWLLWVLDFDGQPTVNSSPDYPQFMLSDANQTLTKY